MHEYTTCVIYYFTHPEVCSSTLKLSLLQKMSACVPQFNEYQLQIFRRLLIQEKLRIEDKQRGSAATNVSDGSINLLPTILEVQAKLDAEVSELQSAKILLSGEEAIREEIRRRLKQMVEDKQDEEARQRSFKLRGTAADQKLKQKVSTKARPKTFFGSVEDEEEEEEVPQKKKADTVEIKQEEKERLIQKLQNKRWAKKKSDQV